MRNHRKPKGVARVEASAQARRRRALAHLDRVRNRRNRRALSIGRIAMTVVAVSLVAGLVAGGAGLGTRPVADVWVSDTRWVTADEIASTAGVRPGTRLETVDAEAIVERLSAHAWVERARVLALPNGTLLIGVRERQPAALLAGEPAWAVDADGVPFATTPERDLEGLVRIESAGQLEPGQPNADLARAVRLARSLPARGLPAPRELRIAAPDDPDGLSLLLPGLEARVVLGREDLDARLADLARLLEADVPDLERATRIDLRFADQAVLDVESSPKGAAQAAAERGGATPSNSRRAG